jgi:hypothetical protein
MVWPFAFQDVRRLNRRLILLCRSVGGQRILERRDSPSNTLLTPWQILIEQVAFDMRGGLCNITRPSHRANEAATHHDILGDHIALGLGIFAKNQRGAMKIALKVAINGARPSIVGSRQVLADGKGS